MHPGLLPAALALAAVLAMAVYVALRRDKSDLHWLLLALLGALLIWSTGSIFRLSVSTGAGLVASLRLLFLGVFAVPPLWVLLAIRLTRVRLRMEPRDLFVVLVIPSVLAYLALLTNEGHRLVMREMSFEALADGGRAWAGPAFWAFVSWGYALMLAGVALYLEAARRMVANCERRRGLVLALAAALPALTTSVYIFRPVPFDVTPSALSLSLVLITAAVFRHQILESLPLARRDVIEHLSDGVVIANAAGVIVDLNPAAEEILGGRAAELRRRRLVDVLEGFAGPEDTVAFRRAVENLAASPQLLVSALRTEEGRRIEVSAALVCDAEGGPAGQFAVLRDRTEERRYERLLRQAQKLETVGTLAAGIAHEVNNPLAFIRANLSEMHRMGELVEEEFDGPHAKLAAELSDLRPIVQETLDGIARIERIVAGMRRLSASRDESRVSIDVNQLVNDAIRLANLRRDGSVELRTQLADHLPRVQGSPQPLVQALLNLLVNARQAVAGVPDGWIEVATWCDGDTAAIRVRDNGPGISDEFQERIFDPFFTTKDPDQGTGLGLAITFDILRDHGGVVELTSRPGEGAAFVARIPVCHD